MITIDPADLSDETISFVLDGLRLELPSMLAADDESPRSHRLLAAGMALAGEQWRRSLTPPPAQPAPGAFGEDEDA